MGSFINIPIKHRRNGEINPTQYNIVRGKKNTEAWTPKARDL